MKSTYSDQFSRHYEALPIQFTEIFSRSKNWTLIGMFVVFLFIYIFLLKTYIVGYTSEPSCRGGSNEYPQCMFCIKNKKISYTPANPIVYVKVGYKVVYISRTCFPDGLFPPVPWACHWQCNDHVIPLVQTIIDLALMLLWDNETNLFALYI